MGRNNSKTVNDYLKKNYDSLRIIVPKGKKADYMTNAKLEGTSLNALVNKLLETHFNSKQNE